VTSKPAAKSATVERASPRGHMSAPTFSRVAHNRLPFVPRSSPDDRLQPRGTLFAFQSALTFCSVQLVEMFPMTPLDNTFVPLMNQSAVLPLPSRHKRSLRPSPL
jgi:hypothetical protein